MQDEGTSDIMAVAGFAPNGRAAVSSAVFCFHCSLGSVSILGKGMESCHIPPWNRALSVNLSFYFRVFLFFTEQVSLIK